MAQKEWKKYKERRQRDAKLMNDFRKSVKHSIAKSKKKKAATDRKRKKLLKKLDSYEKEKQRNQPNLNTEPLTDDEASFGCLSIIIAVVFIVVLIKFGLKKAVISSILILIIAFIIYCITQKNDENYSGVDNNESAGGPDTEELHRHLENIKVYQNVIKTSKDQYAVSCAIDELSRILAILEKCEESDLRSSGITKWELEKIRKLVSGRPIEKPKDSV